MARRGPAAAAALVALVAAGCSAVALTGCGGDASGPSGDRAQTTGDPFAGLPMVDGDPVLTDAQTEAAMELLRTDATAQEFLGQRDYEVRKLGPWLERDEDNRPHLVGATMILRLEQRADYPMREWPAVSYGPGGEDKDTRGIHYKAESGEFAAANVGRLMIDVDLNSGQVVGIQPFGENVMFTLGDELRERVEALGREQVEALGKGE